MKNKLQEGKESVERIKLLIQYSLDKTLSENVKSLDISEQQRQNVPLTSMDNPENQKKSELSAGGYQVTLTDYPTSGPSYPEYCSNPKKALPLPEVCDGIKDEKQLLNLKNFCYYGGPNGNYFIPKESKMFFWDEKLIIAFADQISKEYKPEYDDPVNRERLIANLSQEFEIGTISQFTDSEGRLFKSSITRPDPSYQNQDYLQRKIKGELQPNVGSWRFGGFRTKDYIYYINPYCLDFREKYQKVLDDWMPYLQWGGILAGIILSAGSGGALWALYAELAIDSTAGGLYALREFQKGNNISGAFGILFCVIPYMKLSSGFRSISKKTWEEVSEKIIRQKPQNQEDLVIFYDSLSQDGKKAWNQIVRRDEISREQILKQIESEFGTSIDKMLWNEAKEFFKNNPDKVQKIKLWKRVWFKETSLQTASMGVSIFLEIFFPNLDSKEKEILNKAMFFMPPPLKLEFQVNLINVSDKEEIVTTICANLKPAIESGLMSIINEPEMKTVVKDSIESAGEKYIDVPEYNIESAQSYEGLSQEEIDNFVKQGWKKLTSSDKVTESDSIMFIDDPISGTETWILKKEESSSTPSQIK